MSTNTQALLVLARELVQGPTEAHLRASISRSYYAAFHACQQFHAALPAPGTNHTGKGGVHQDLINRLLTPSPETSKQQGLREKSRKLGAALSNLKLQRHEADYELAKTIEPDQAQTTERLATTLEAQAAH